MSTTHQYRRITCRRIGDYYFDPKTKRIGDYCFNPVDLPQNIDFWVMLFEMPDVECIAAMISEEM